VKIFSFQGPKNSDKTGDNVEHIKAERFQGRVGLRNMLECLSTSFGCNDVLVEAGSTLSTSFINENLVDELIVYIAPKILGRDARPLTEIIGLNRMDDGLQFKVKEVKQIGPDIKVILTR
jgi:diaminohydroxyphosphoribosylaminopyrimidine deaminase/5-amino-6-(5-phosphoribosylamino)uracil reductase